MELLELDKQAQYLKKRFFDNQLLALADDYLKRPIPHITDHISPRSLGGPHDYYSEADYWWPNPETADGLPYIQRDGETNPDNFDYHRYALRDMKEYVLVLTLAYLHTNHTSYAKQAVRILQEFFLNEETRMNPHLNYAQAICGISPGRGIGIIDTIHLVEIPYAAERLYQSGILACDDFAELQTWFHTYLDWLLSSPNGNEESQTKNNHAVCYYMQVAAFAKFLNEDDILEEVKNTYINRLLEQMNTKGQFPLELRRTKPYNYSAFILDNLLSICFFLSEKYENIWFEKSATGKTTQNAIDFMVPYILNKGLWPYPPDVMFFDEFPCDYSFLLLTGEVLNKEDWIKEYYKLKGMTKLHSESARNLAIRWPEIFYK